MDLLGTNHLQVLVAVAAILLHFRFGCPHWLLVPADPLLPPDRTLVKIFGNCLTGVCLRLGIVKDEMDEAPVSMLLLLASVAHSDSTDAPSPRLPLRCRPDCRSDIGEIQGVEQRLALCS